MKLSVPHSLFLAALLTAPSSQGAANGWLAWRGPHQNGTSDETGLPSTVDVKKPLWTADFHGASTPVIANGKLYIMGFVGDGPDLQEGVTCFDAGTGKKLWEYFDSDYLSDIIYNRYSTSSPAVDPETGNVYTQGTQGNLTAFTAGGKLLWQIPMMELYGRLTFPNGRTASPVIDGDLVITRGITANWGANGPAGDRFYAFDKKTGELVWTSSPADRPKDSCFAYPYLGWLDGKRVFYSTAGDGSAVCANARTGDPIWRVPLGKAGINASIIVWNNERVVAIYGTPYEPGQMVCFAMPKVKPGASGPVVVERAQVELWSLDISTSTSSPILVGDRIYVVAEKGDLHAVNIKTGKIDWSLKLGIEQRNSCPFYADGKLYVPMLDDPASKKEGESDAGTKGALYIIKPGDTKGEILQHITVDGRCFGTPVAYNGKLYLQTTKQLYCWGKAGNSTGVPRNVEAEKWPTAGPATQLQIIPSEVVLTPGKSASFRVRKLDANGFTVEEVKNVSTVKWAGYIPPTAKVKASMDAKFNDKGQLVASTSPVPSAGAYEATLGNLKGYIRGRVLNDVVTADFENFQVTLPHPADHPQPGMNFAYPPLPWIGARFKFEVTEKDGGKVLSKTIDNKFFQRGTVFFGPPDLRNYTIEADLMTEGDRRKKSEVGIICQRYLVVLKGNDNKLEISSNLDRLRVPAATDPSNFTVVAKTWYHVKARVDTKPDGSGVVRGKAWKRGESEPDAWTIEVPVKHAHQQGSPGLYGFAPQDIPCHIDNIKVTLNK